MICSYDFIKRKLTQFLISFWFSKNESFFQAGHKVNTKKKIGKKILFFGIPNQPKGRNLRLTFKNTVWVSSLSKKVDIFSLFFQKGSRLDIFQDLKNIEFEQRNFFEIKKEFPKFIFSPRFGIVWFFYFFTENFEKFFLVNFQSCQRFVCPGYIHAKFVENKSTTIFFLCIFV